MAILQQTVPLPQNAPLVDPETGMVTIAFQRWWQAVTMNAETTQGDVEGKVDQGAITSGQLTMAADRLLGRNTASVGAIEELTLSEALDLIGSVAHGDILYRDSATWARLAAGTDGDVLTTHGAADPTWETPSSGGSAAWALAGTGQTATGIYDQAVDGTKANVDFVGLASFNEVLVICRGLAASVSGVRQVVASVDNGSTFDTTAANYKAISTAGVEANAATPALGFHGTNSGSARSVVVHIKNLKGAAKEAFSPNSGDILYVGSANDINAIRINSHLGGNITAGTVRVYAR